MSEQKKESNLKSGASRWEEKVKKARNEAENADEKPAGAGKAERGFACLFWILAFFCEGAGVYLFFRCAGAKIYPAIVFLAAALILVLVSSLLWKKGNKKDPVKSGSKSFFCRTYLGMILSSAAFLPLVLPALFGRGEVKAKLLSVGAALLAAAIMVSAVLFI